MLSVAVMPTLFERDTGKMHSGPRGHTFSRADKTSVGARKRLVGIAVAGAAVLLLFFTFGGGGGGAGVSPCAVWPCAPHTFARKCSCPASH